MRNLTLMTDLYQLTMMNGYYLEKKQNDIAIFDVFFREKGEISYAVACGLEQVIDYLENISFTQEDIAYLRSLDIFDGGFLKQLEKFRFTGNVYAVPEGSVVFPMEPILTVEAPIWEAQLVETTILNLINHQTLIATKASKICTAAGGGVMEFGLRRAQGPDAGIYGARAAVIAGCDSTSNVLAGKMFDVPVSGTHSHSWVMSFDSELQAFRAYAKAYPQKCLLLVDTYDTLKSGIPNAIKVFEELRARGYEPLGIRLDSGDLSYLSKRARELLDGAGFPNAKICASGDLDENLIQDLKSQGAKIDIWGVGTKLITSENFPSLGGVYKISAIRKNGEYIPKLKISDNPAKITNPGFKTLYRLYDENDKALADLIALHDEVIDDNKPITITHPVDRWKKTVIPKFRAVKLLKKVMGGGKPVEEKKPLKEIKAYCKKQLDSFWDEYKRLVKPHVYKVDLSDGLYTVKQELLTKGGRE